MTTTARLYLEIAGAVLAVVLGGLWLHEHDKRIEQGAVAKATEDANKNALAIIEQHDAANRAQLDAFMKNQQAQVDTLKSTVASLKTPQQQVAWSQEQLKDALKGITITLDSKGQAVATIPAATLPALPQVIEECKECKLNLATANQKLTYADQQHADDIQKLKLANDSSDKWEKAYKGGSTWHRVWKATEYLAIGGAVGFVAGHKF